MVDPYADAAPGYLTVGWSPVPLPYRRKEPPPAETTGYAGAYADEESVAAWSQGGPHNVGLRLPETVLGLDVDGYGDKRGAATLAEHEDRLGELPATWRSTARHDDPVSGIRYYRVPAGRRWVGELVGGGVEVIHHGHRYAVAWPSIHPDTGGTYGWYDPVGQAVEGTIPAPEDLPALPEAWVEALNDGQLSSRDVKAALTSGEVGRWLAALPEGEPCPAVARALYDGQSEFLVSADSRHGVARRASARLVRLGEQGHSGVAGALAELEEAFYEALAGERDGTGEWVRLVAGAVALVVADPTPEADRGCCPERSTAAEDFGPWGDMFDATDTLRHIRTAAHARMVAPGALLAYVLGRVLAEVPPETTLPPTIGSAASLNLGVAVVSLSGGGKSVLLDVSRELLGLSVTDQDDIERVLGSGEGLAQTFLKYDRQRKANVLISDPRRIVTVDEIDQLGATQSRSGATVGPALRSALTGGQIGSENATAERRRLVPARKYRLVMYVGVQPTRSGALLDDYDAGTPQRFLWVFAEDPTLPDETPPWPGELAWTVPRTGEHIDYPEHIVAEVQEARRRRMRGEAPPLEGHLMLTRLKVAAALALLHGESTITDRWWTLAKQLLDASLAVQEHCRAVLAEEAQRKRSSAAIATARAEEDVDEDKVARAAKLILAKVRAARGDWVTRHAVRPGTHRLREHMDDAIDRLRAAGQVEVKEYEARSGPAVRLRYVGGNQ